MFFFNYSGIYSLMVCQFNFQVVRIPYTTKALSAIGESRGDVVSNTNQIYLHILFITLFKKNVYLCTYQPFPDLVPRKYFHKIKKFLFSCK